MSLPVKWSPSSKEEFADLLNYVEVHFRLDAALALLDKTERAIDNISKQPELFPVSDKSPAIRKAVITKQTSLFYRIRPTEIQLLHFWDNRRNPDTLEFLI
jgi:plasmid stabilization system protein ParE